MNYGSVGSSPVIGGGTGTLGGGVKKKGIEGSPSNAFTNLQDYISANSGQAMLQKEKNLGGIEDAAMDVANILTPTGRSATEATAFDKMSAVSDIQNMGNKNTGLTGNVFEDALTRDALADYSRTLAGATDKIKGDTRTWNNIGTVQDGVDFGGGTIATTPGTVAPTKYVSNVSTAGDLLKKFRR